MQENGTALSSKYALVNGSNAAGTWRVNTTGNAGTVTNGLYSVQSYSNPTWPTSVLGSIVSGNISGNAAGFTGSLSGDVTGSQGSMVVGALQGTSVSSTAPSSGQVLKFNGTRWAPADLPKTAATPSYNPLQIALLKWYANTITSFSVGSAPEGVAFDGSHTWVANDGSVSKL